MAATIDCRSATVAGVLTAALASNPSINGTSASLVVIDDLTTLSQQICDDVYYSYVRIEQPAEPVIELDVLPSMLSSRLLELNWNHSLHYHRDLSLAIKQLDYG